MTRVFSIQAAELMSGVDAPVGEPDPKGFRNCALRLHVHGTDIIKVEVLGEGYVEGVPQPSPYSG